MKIVFDVGRVKKGSGVSAPYPSHSFHLYPIPILNASFIYFRSPNLIGGVEALLMYYIEMDALPLLFVLGRYSCWVLGQHMKAI